ncbi:MAG: signal peptidase I [Ruminococcus sp.]|nr:signal peptidase I [Ruminococcus sp.]
MTKIEKMGLPTAEQLDGEIKRVRHRKEYIRVLRSTISSLIVVAAIAVLVSLLFLPVLRVTGTSMAPTFQNDELVICRKYGEFKQGDVIAFYLNNKILLKRVIGVSGDVIDMDSDGTVYVNGEAIDEPYLSEKSFGECDLDLPYQVPDQRVFVMGDHRATSVDSRSTAVGCIANEAIVGEVMLRIWPFEQIGLV